MKLIQHYLFLLLSFICLSKCSIIFPHKDLRSKFDVEKFKVRDDMVFTKEQDQELFSEENIKDTNENRNGERTGVRSLFRWVKYSDDLVYIPYIFDSSFCKLFSKFHVKFNLI